MATARNARRRLGLLVAASLAVAGPASANQLTQQFVNPLFGGSPLNATALANQASSNNYRFANPPASASTSGNGSAAQTFQQEITSALLSGIASNISNEITGQNALSSGSFVVGGETINFNRAGGQIIINLSDGTAAGTTQIQLPVPQY